MSGGVAGRLDALAYHIGAADPRGAVDEALKNSETLDGVVKYLLKNHGDDTLARRRRRGAKRSRIERIRASWRYRTLTLLRNLKPH